METRVGDIVRLKKRHACGANEWQVVRVGADIGIRCQRCHRRVLLERGVFERRVRGSIPQAAHSGAGEGSED